MSALAVGGLGMGAARCERSRARAGASVRARARSGERARQALAPCGRAEKTSEERKKTERGTLPFRPREKKTERGRGNTGKKVSKTSWMVFYRMNIVS